MREQGLQDGQLIVELIVKNFLCGNTFRRFNESTYMQYI